MKRILIIQTGGTIAMEEDKETGTVSPKKINSLHTFTANIDENATIETEEICNIPSPHMTMEKMLQLGRIIKQRLDNEIQGVVVTHGTDTLEETAYFLDLFLKTNTPIIVTGAMRSSNEIGSDGPHNLLSAIRVALSDYACKKGVLVVLNDEIHSAKNVTKTHTSNVATFQSPQYGPIGIVTKRGVNIHFTPTYDDFFPIQTISKHVHLLKAYAGMDDSIFQLLNDSNMDGLVIEALGQGNLPPQTLPGIKALLKRNIPIVLVSRCFNGIVQDVYNYEGGGKHLKDLGLIFSNGLSGQKARIKLTMALQITNDCVKMREWFQK